MVFEEIVVNQFLQSYSGALLTLFFKAITYLGHPGVWFILAAWLFWMGRERKSFIIMLLILFSGFVVGVLKEIIARPRPEGILILAKETSYAFPSGHSTLSAAFASFAYFSKKLEKQFKYLLIIGAIIVAVSRLYLGVHFLSDVIAGLIIGSVIGWIVFKAEEKINKMHFHISKIQEEYLVVGFFAAIILIDLFVPSQYLAAYAFLGYFAGYVIYKHSKIDLTRTTSKKQSLIALIIGTIILGGLYFFGDENTGLIAQTTFFIAGMFVTIFWPVIIDRFVKKRETHKISKKMGFRK